MAVQDLTIFLIKKKKPQKELILFYLIEEVHQSHKYFYSKKNSWNKLQNQTLKYLIEFAKDNPNSRIILKGKTGVHKKNDFNLKIFPNNFTFIEGGPGEKYLRDAKVVIAFRSMVVFEAIASNRNLIYRISIVSIPKKKSLFLILRIKNTLLILKTNF